MTTTDILVIAGGTAAAHLARSARVVLAEAEHAPGHHTTGRSAAIWIGACGPPDAQALARASRGLLFAPPAGFTGVPLARPRIVPRLAPADETDSDPCDAAPDEYDVALGIARAQQAREIEVRRVVRAWAGLRSVTPDRGLAIGQGRLPGLFWMAGQGGYGIQTSPAAGRLLVALVLKEAPEEAPLPVLGRLDPRSFPA